MNKQPIKQSQRSVASKSVFRKALFRTIGWGSRLALDEKPTKSNQTKPNQTKIKLGQFYALFTVDMTSPTHLMTRSTASEVIM